VSQARHNDLPAVVRNHYPWQGRYLNIRGAESLRDGQSLRMHYLDEGKGEPLLMVHGNPTWSFYWRTLVSDLAPQYRCIVPDHIGCGLSDKPQDWTYRLQDHIENLSILIEALDLHDVTLVVHDWGGAIGFGAALKHLPRIKRLVLFNTAVFLGPVPLSIRMCRWPLVGPAVVQGLNGFIRVGLLRAIADRTRMKGGIGKGYLAPYNSWKNRIAHLQFIRDIPLEEDHPTRRLIQELDERTDELSNLPALLIWGEKDFVFTTDFLKRWQAKFPEAEVHTLPNAAHFVVEDAHETIIPLVRSFLNRHPLPQD
jgi:cis-3-alkyl-4-acyloxetan-2-one decarboxylase